MPLWADPVRHDEGCGWSKRRRDSVRVRRLGRGKRKLGRWLRVGRRGPAHSGVGSVASI